MSENEFGKRWRLPQPEWMMYDDHKNTRRSTTSSSKFQAKIILSNNLTFYLNPNISLISVDKNPHAASNCIFEIINPP